MTIHDCGNPAGPRNGLDDGEGVDIAKLQAQLELVIKSYLAQMQAACSALCHGVPFHVVLLGYQIEDGKRRPVYAVDTSGPDASETVRFMVQITRDLGRFETAKALDQMPKPTHQVTETKQ